MRRLLLLVSCACCVLAGCSGPTHPARGISTSDLTLTRQFGDFTVYWAGRSFQGIPLTAADSELDYDPELGMRFYYGDCERHSSPLSSVGCRLPLEVVTVVYLPHSNDGLGARRVTRLRGVEAVIFDRGRSIELYTGSTFAVDIYADTPARALAAVRAIVPANEPGAASDPLPAAMFRPGPHGSRHTLALARLLRAHKPAALHHKAG